MSYMKTGCANCWVMHEFEHKTKTGHLHFIDWLDFKEEFQKGFLLLDAEAAAINTLETSTYFQGKCLVDDYLDMFMDRNGHGEAFRHRPKCVVLPHCPDGPESCGR